MGSSEEFVNMFRNVAGMTDPAFSFNCNKCGEEMALVEKGRSFDFQKMFYCKNNHCVRFGLVWLRLSQLKRKSNKKKNPLLLHKSI